MDKTFAFDSIEAIGELPVPFFLELPVFLVMEMNKTVQHTFTRHNTFYNVCSLAKNRCDRFAFISLKLFFCSENAHT